MTKLVTRDEWERMSPDWQGYYQYMQGDLPGSELRNIINPYPANSRRFKEYERGQMVAMLEAQDSEE